MGRLVEVRREAEGDRLGSPGTFDRHIASLITQLEDLLDERARCGRADSVPPDPNAAAAAHLAAPYSDFPSVAPSGFPAGRAALARAIVQRRRLRSEFLPPTLFAEPAWDMLLDLYAAHHEGKRVSVSSLCIAAAVPSTTALRSIEGMTEQGCLVRERDPDDGRRIFVALSDKARRGLDAWFDAVGS
ncbi:winged helix DNA-binding protein [Sphingopyxis sp.]|uniref:winged helix DNA-binding protein n=1 Tax=Sphingopyxis sp. TaxID=1908224 RepID=UPI003BAB5632